MSDGETIICGPFARWMNRRGWGGFTVGGRAYYWGPPSEALRRHEAVHARQQHQLGWRFWFAYAWEHIRRGYDGNRLEVEARAAE